MSDAGPEPPGWTTPSPIVVWNSVAGASAYDLDVYTRRPDAVCDYQWAKDNAQDFHVVTPLTAWTPLAKPGGSVPYPSTGVTVEKSDDLAAGDHYCVRIRAVGETSSTGDRVYGDYTFLDDAFTYVPSAAGGAVALPSSGDYISPVGGALSKQTPFFTWHPIAGANSYWVIVARDPSFTTLVDYGFTQVPAYAPRLTIADETTSYYWAVLPAQNSDGTVLPTSPVTGRPVDPLHASAANFQKRSDPPVLLPVTGPPVSQPKFQWSYVPGARNYRLEVSTDPNFGTLLDNVVTGSTAYVSTTTYPAQSTLYWRVQANDERLTALTWSSPATFRQVLPVPQLPAQSSSSGDLIPSWSWQPVDGAVYYDVRVVLPGGSEKIFSKVPTPATVPIELSGAGVFAWQVRAHFTGGAVGPYSPLVSFHRAVPPPTRTAASVSRRALILRWQGMPGIKEYVVEIASRPDFSHRIETDKTKGTIVASNLKGFAKGGRFYWRVAAVDADGNLGGFSKAKRFRFRGIGRH
jgi:hypothetical protein